LKLRVFVCKNGIAVNRLPFASFRGTLSIAWSRIITEKVPDLFSLFLQGKGAGSILATGEA
jgi:hypothetical protein